MTRPTGKLSPSTFGVTSMRMKTIFSPVAATSSSTVYQFAAGKCAYCPVCCPGPTKMDGNDPDSPVLFITMSAFSEMDLLFTYTSYAPRFVTLLTVTFSVTVSPAFTFDAESTVMVPQMSSSAAAAPGNTRTIIAIAMRRIIIFCCFILHFTS